MKGATLSIFIGIFIAIFLIFAPGSIFIFSLAFLFGWLIWLRLPEQNEKKFLLAIFSIGFLFRIFALLFIHFLLGLSENYFEELGKRVIAIFGDSGYYTILSWRMTRYWLGESIFKNIFQSPFYFSYGWSGYLYILSLFHYLFGFSPIASKFINCFLGTTTAIIIYFIAKEIFTIKVARLSAIFTIFFPSMFLWSLTNLKEPSIIFLVSFSLWSFINFQKRKKLYPLIFLALALLFLATLRRGLGLCMLIVIGVSYICMIKSSLIKKIGIFLIAIIILQTFLFVNNSSLKSTISEGLTGIVNRHKGFVATGGSVYKLLDEKYYLVNPADMNRRDYIKMLFKGWGHFLLEPFPWKIHTKLMLLSYPQTILWYILMPFVFLGMILAVRYNWRFSLILFVYLFIIGSSLAMSGGNIGTHFRFRDMVTPVFLVFASAGLLKIFGHNLVLANDKS